MNLQRQLCTWNRQAFTNHRPHFLYRNKIYKRPSTKWSWAFLHCCCCYCFIDMKHHASLRERLPCSSCWPVTYWASVGSSKSLVEQRHFGVWGSQRDRFGVSKGHKWPPDHGLSTHVQKIQSNNSETKLTSLSLARINNAARTTAGKQCTVHIKSSQICNKTAWNPMMV